MPISLERLSLALADRDQASREIGRGGMAVVPQAQDARPLAWLALPEQPCSFGLINLGPASLGQSAESFGKLVRASESRIFRHVSWTALLPRLSNLPSWLVQYLRERGLA